MKKTQRLSKILAAAGVASRRKAEDLIFSGKVEVNGEVTRLPQTPVDPEKDTIKVDRKLLPKIEKKLYFMLNKPKKYVCSTKSTKNSPSVLELFSEEIRERLFTAGRLDKDTTGLLIVTNDGEYANRIIHPSSNIQKQYIAKTAQEITHDHLCIISKGTLVANSFIKPTQVKKIRKGTVSVTVKEGKKHEVRLLLKTAGLKVLGLKRTRIGGLSLGTLPNGQWKPMSEKEQEQVFN